MGCNIRLIIRIRDKGVVSELKRFGKILYISKLTNIVGLDAKTIDASRIKEIDDVMDVRESSKGVIAV